MSDQDEVEGVPESEGVRILEGSLAELQRAAALLKRHGIEAALGSSDAEGCASRPSLWLEVAPEQLQAAAEVFDRDWRQGLDAAQLTALEAASRIVIDPDARETTCPACLTTFTTGPSACPECGLGLG
jgi:hypothetical protein